MNINGRDLDAYAYAGQRFLRFNEYVFTLYRNIY